MRSGEHSASAHGILRRLGNGSEAVTVDERGVVVQNIYVLIAVNVQNEGAMALREHERVRVIMGDRTCLASWQVMTELFETATGEGGLLLVSVDR